jgi:type I restriction enzyme, R subunit
MVNRYTEDVLVEQPAIALFAELGWQTVNAMHERLGPDGTLGRDSEMEVVLSHRLMTALQRLIPGAAHETLELAVSEITRSRAALHHVRANQEVYDLLKQGVTLQVRQPDGGELPETIDIIDWEHPEANDFLLVSQLWIRSDLYRRRADLVGFVNGIPLVFVELKASHRDCRAAFDDNLTDYRATVPQIFTPNGIVILSNGREAKLGSMSYGWEYFGEWKKVDSEAEEGRVGLETMLRATCIPQRLLDIVEHFTLFMERPGGLQKLVARNHQYVGVNNAIARLVELRTAPEGQRGRLGVFWHTQGSGKTVSMIFFSQKVLRTLLGGWTFVIVTDRQDLDGQAYGGFFDAGVVTEEHVQAENAQHLRLLLGEEHRYVFTLIHKFRTERGEPHPVLTERDDVIVITDEAHRTQYDVLALNMRKALPHASFLGFTGTPLIAGEERTREVFGDYVSIYNFAESRRDGATVPLVYENRIPQLQLANPTFDEDLLRILEEAELDEAQESKLGRLFAQQYELITREDRLEIVARDIVDHFLGRGFTGKAMVVSIDKATALRTYDKVQKHWKARLYANQVRLDRGGLTLDEATLLREEIAQMHATDMAVVISSSQNEIAEMTERGLDIRPHRKRMVEQDLEEKFKDPADKLRIAFVCAMWTTGFDVPCCSTIYLDKPMRNHTLMQTISRANRVFPDKTNGIIVAYVDVFRDLQKALALYAVSGGIDRGALPIEEKAVLVDELRIAIDEAIGYCADRGVSLAVLTGVGGFEFVGAAQDAVELLIVNDEEKAAFLEQARLVDKLFKAILPDGRAAEFGPIRAVLKYLADHIANLNLPVDVSPVLRRVEQLLDESVAARAYVIKEGDDGSHIDLNDVDWDALQRTFDGGHQRTAAERLRSLLTARVTRLARLNPTRRDLLERFQQLIDEYNAGSSNVEEFFRRLVAFTHDLTAEEQRTVVEHLTEEQLAVYDLLLRPAPDLTDAERAEVKRVAESLLGVLKREKLVLDWRKEQQSRAAVRLAVEETLDELPQKYDRKWYAQKCDAVYEHVFESYWDDGRSVYDRVA